MLEEQVEVIIQNEVVHQTNSVYQSSHSILPTLLGLRLEEHICMGLSIGPEVLQIMDHFAILIYTMSHVLCAILQHEEQ